MTIEIEQLLAWQPDNFSEDHVSNFLAQVFKSSRQWHIVYYNPPHGSWKTMIFIKDNYEYRQVTPKRGVKRIKRPDIALQFLSSEKDQMTLLLIEAKQSQSMWSPELVTLLKAYFEGYEGSKALRQIPFLHRRKVGEIEWNEVQKGDPEAEWLMRHKIDYLFGFAYNLGLVRSTADLLSDISWMTKTIENLQELPPIVLMAVGWFNKTYRPLILMQFSETFPANIKKNLEEIFSDYLFTPQKKLLHLNNFI